LALEVYGVRLTYIGFYMHIYTWCLTVSGVEPSGVYMGRFTVRSYRGYIYVHLRPSIVESNGFHVNRKVMVTAILDGSRCSGSPHSRVVLRFKATVTRVRSSKGYTAYRVIIPSSYRELLKPLAGCAKLDVWFEPIPQAQPPATASSLKPVKPQPRISPAEAPRPLIPQPAQPKLKPLEAVRARVEERLEELEGEGSEDYLVDLGRPGGLSRLSRILGFKVKRW